MSSHVRTATTTWLSCGIAFLRVVSRSLSTPYLETSSPGYTTWLSSTVAEDAKAIIQFCWCSYRSSACSSNYLSDLFIWSLGCYAFVHTPCNSRQIQYSSDILCNNFQYHPHCWSLSFWHVGLKQQCEQELAVHIMLCNGSHHQGKHVSEPKTSCSIRIICLFSEIIEEQRAGNRLMSC